MVNTLVHVLGFDSPEWGLFKLNHKTEWTIGTTMETAACRCSSK